MHNHFIEIFAIFLLILANGFFSLSEFSIIASRRSKLKRMAKEGFRGSAKAVKIHTNPEKFLAAVQIGITFVGTFAGVFSGMTIVNLLLPVFGNIPVDFIAKSARPLALFTVVFGISFLSVVLGELVPKYIALSTPEKIASAVAGPMTIFTTLGSVIVRLLSATAKKIAHLLGFKQISQRSTINEDDIDMIIAEGRETGTFDATEQQLIHSIFDFTDVTARMAMTPRTDIVGIELGDKQDKIIKTMADSGFSRYPVYRETLDHIEGILYTKDVISALHRGEKININDVIRKPLFVPDSMMLTTLLQTFQQKRVHAAIVLDEFGGTAGMITLEDLLEEIVGEIHDEHDHDVREFVRETRNVAYAAGTFRVDELNDDFGTVLDEDGPDTLGGLVFEELGHLPHKGETVTIGDVRFKVLEIRGNRIVRLKIEKIPQEKSGES